MTEKRIKAVMIIHKDMNATEVTATFEDGTEDVVLRYYPDEVSYTTNEFIGKTSQEVADMHHRKDVAYLQS